MEELLLGARLVLALTFLVAAAAKVADMAGSRRSLEQLGAPRALVPAVAVALPIVEVAVAVALVPVASAWLGAVAAAMLLAFSAAVASAFARGIEADCHCFGRASSRPVGPATLGRNLALLALAGFVALAGADDAGASATAWISGLSTSATVALVAGSLLAAAVALNAAVLFQLFKQNGRLWGEIEEMRKQVGVRPRALALGELAPAFAALDLSGRPVELDDLLDDGRGVILTFTSTDRVACEPLLPELGRLQRQPGGGPYPGARQPRDR